MIFKVTLVAGDFEAEWKPTHACLLIIWHAILKTGPPFLEELATAVLARTAHNNDRPNGDRQTDSPD